MTDTNGRRIHELAKDLSVSSKELREQIVALGFDWDVSNHMKVLTSDQIAQYRAKVAGGDAAPKRIHELAKEMGVSSKELRETITGLGFDWDVSNHMKVLTGAQQDELAKAAAAPKKSAKKKTAAKKKTDAKKAKKDDDKGADAKKAKKDDDKGADAKKDEKKAKKPKEAGGRNKAEKAGKEANARTKRRDDRRPHREDLPDPEGFDPVGAGVPYVKAILKHLGLPRARVSGTYDGRRLEININGGGAVELIGAANAGANGRMIEALQLLASKAAFGDLSRARTLAIDVNGFRAGRVDALQNAGKRIAKFVAKSQVHVRLPAMNNFDRYAFHKSAGRTRGVDVGSEGFGAFRMLGISPRVERKREERPPRVETEAKVEAKAEAPVEAPVEALVEAPVEAPVAEKEIGETKRRRRRRSPQTAE